MGRTSSRTKTRAVAVVTLAALFASTATAAQAVSPGEVTSEITLPAGRYVVLLDEPAAATYEGGEAGLERTAPVEGDKLDTSDPAVQEYVEFLEERQDEVAATVGAAPDASYQVSLNGFSADLSAAQASKLAAQRGIRGVYPDEVLHTTVAKNTDFLGLSGAEGAWATQFGGVENAGEGVVVGIIDTGIASDNPSFAGAPLGTAPGTGEPYLDGNTVVFDKADGTQFRSERVTGEAWDASDYSTKLIGGKYFDAGARAAGWFDLPTSTREFASPRDTDGHGSHTGGTAAGNPDVDATVNGFDYGLISGIAPQAKVAAYKACYSGDLDDVTTDDICATSDLLSAIDAAVADGVDVINFSIGGGAATSVLDAFDYAFLNAAAAGVFVSVSAGNDGPGTSTLDHASPWYTTVANSTMTSETATLVLGDGSLAAGLTLGIPEGVDLADKGIVWSRTAGTDVEAGPVAQCTTGTLDPAAVTGKIVVCDRGGNFLYQKADEVKRAGGIATVILNNPATAQTVFGGSYATPTVHIPAQFFDAISGYLTTAPEPTASLVPGNQTTWVAPAAPALNSSSSRGPALAGGSDVLKPDVAAPGTDVLAAVANEPNTDPAFNFLTGTSMAAPQVAGLAALYLGVHPNASPAEIKSALMTTAYDTVYEDGSPDLDPFDQGAGHVDATRYLNPGAVYLNGVDDWLAYLQGTGIDAGVTAIDPSDLNLASIAIGTLADSQTVTRTLTATAAGSFTAQIDVPGVDAVVEPSTVSFGAAGETATFTVTLTPTTAPTEQWATGFLTWTGDTTVRSPIAVYPVTADAEDVVEGVGITGSVSSTFLSGVDGDLELHANGLGRQELLTDPEFDVPGHTGDQDSFYDEDGQFNTYFEVEVPEGTLQTRFDVDESNDDGSVDLDLVVYYIYEGAAYLAGQSATGSGDESVVLDDPDAGSYVVLVNRYFYDAPFTWDMTTVNIAEGAGEGDFTVAPNPIPVTKGAEATYTASWTGLEPESTYFGLVQYGDSAVRTLVVVESGEAAPVATTAPKISGTPKVGKTLTATAGTWDPATVTTAFQWLRDGAPIDGATTASYKVVKADVGKSLSVRVTATAEGNPNAGVAESAAVFVKFTSKLSVGMNRYIGTSSATYAVSIAVTPSGGPAATGKVTVYVDAKKYTATLSGGKAKITLPKQSRGIHLVVASYPGSATVEASSGLTGFVVLR